MQIWQSVNRRIYAMYRHAKSVDWCQCCQWGVSLTDFESSANFFGNYDTPKVVHSSDNSCCGARHLPASTVLLGICRPLPLAQVAWLRHRRRSHRFPVAFIYLSPFLVGNAFMHSVERINPFPTTIILQITLLVSVKERRLYRHIYFLCWLWYNYIELHFRSLLWKQ